MYEKVNLPIKDSDFDPEEIPMRDSCKALVDIMSPSICYLGSYVPFENSARRNGIEKYMNFIKQEINKSATSYLTGLTGEIPFDKSISRRIASHVSELVSLIRGTREQSVVKHHSSTLADLVLLQICSYFDPKDLNASLSTSLAILAGLLSGLLCSGNSHLVAKSNLSEQSEILVTAIFENLRVKISSTEVMSTFSYDNPAYSYEDEQTPDSYARSATAKAIKVYIAKSCKYEDISNEVVNSGRLARTINSLINGMTFTSSNPQPFHLYSAAEDLVALVQSLHLSATSVGRSKNIAESRISLASEIISQTIVDNIYSIIKENPMKLEPAMNFCCGLRPSTLLKPNVWLRKTSTHTPILSDRLEEFHIIDETQFRRVEDFSSQWKEFEGSLTSDYKGHQSESPVIDDVCLLVAEQLEDLKYYVRPNLVEQFPRSVPIF